MLAAAGDVDSDQPVSLADAVRTQPHDLGSGQVGLNVLLERLLEVAKDVATGRPVAEAQAAQTAVVRRREPSATSALKWWKAKGWGEFVGRSPTQSDPLFPTPKGDYGLSRWADFLRADLAVAKLPTLFDGKHNITFHAMRRTFMTLLEGEGVSRDLISALAVTRGAPSPTATTSPKTSTASTRS